MTIDAWSMRPDPHDRAVDAARMLRLPPRSANAIHLRGSLAEDPQLRSLEDGTSVCRLRLAVDCGADDVDDFIDIATFGRTAQACAGVLSEGWVVAIAGRVDPDGIDGQHVIGELVEPVRLG